jgi:hypothetical protein
VSALDDAKAEAVSAVEARGHVVRQWWSDGDVQAAAPCENDGCEGAVRVFADERPAEGMCIDLDCPASHVEAAAVAEARAEA